MKVLLLSKYSRLGASSRLRSLQYLPALARAGIQVDPLPLFDDAYLQRLYMGRGRSMFAVARCYGARVQKMRQLARAADLIWVEKEALPYIPFWLEDLLMPREVPYVVDYDDAVFHNYDKARNPLVRWLLRRKIDQVMSKAATVICGNEYLMKHARLAGAKNIVRVPTVVDSDRYAPLPDVANTRPVIGWIGSPSTQHYVFELRSVFKRLHQIYGIRLVLVGARPEVATKFEPVPTDIVPWSEQTEAQHVAHFDIGIMPLRDDLWERGKCGYKLIQYMACAKPVVASPVGVNTEIVQGSNCGLLARGHDQWLNALDQLLSEPDTRIEFGTRGRLAVEARYSLQAQSARVVDILRRAV